ncbi:thioredoxin domain-containing protein [Burkholderia pyrrocinia]|uniref:DsbA family protein n=1 Tax=Burkholderia pyrrocinia TaxID=60550 RepID=UPI001FB45C84|nr:thioredoxin domain-containing protein [Burkholderia pyrrocinia]UOB57002.1 thioredoxin domain-containing protein [Burkholderia pyrrocinia]
MKRNPPLSRPLRLLIVWTLVALMVLALWWLRPSRAPAPPGAPPSPPAAETTSGPPWRYGNAEARFTLVLFADLECDHCRTYFPRLMQWVDAHPDVMLQWHHRPLPLHEPAATKEARLAECLGKVNGAAAFWNAIAWIYLHTRGNGQGLPDNTPPPGMTPAVRHCVNDEASAAAVRSQAEDAVHAGINATPTLHLTDRETGGSTLLQGAVEGDVLLSALDWLAGASPHPLDTPHTEMPADDVGMPR